MREHESIITEAFKFQGITEVKLNRHGTPLGNYATPEEAIANCNKVDYCTILFYKGTSRAGYLIAAPNRKNTALDYSSQLPWMRESAKRDKP